MGASEERGIAIQQAPAAALRRAFQGVVNATHPDAEAIKTADDYLPFVLPEQESTSLEAWQTSLISPANNIATISETAQHILLLSTAITYFSLHPTLTPTPQDISTLTNTLYKVLRGPLFSGISASRSHQGFLSIPLCSIPQPNGENEQLWRLHVWLPNRPQPDPRFAKHSHKSFAQGWILAGEGLNTLWDARTVVDGEEEEEKSAATHAIFKLVDDRVLTSADTSAVIANTGELMHVRKGDEELHRRNVSYTVPVDHFHTSEVPLKQVHATLFVFDAGRGFVGDAGVSLGPKNITRLEQHRNPGGASAALLAEVVYCVWHWEVEMSRGLRFAEVGEWSRAVETFDAVLAAWKPKQWVNVSRGDSGLNDFAGLARYRLVALILGKWARDMSNDK